MASLVPSLAAVLAAFGPGALVSPAFVPLAAVAAPGAPVPAAAFLAGLPAGVRRLPCRVARCGCSGGLSCRFGGCGCPSLSVVVGSARVLVWLPRAAAAASLWGAS